MSRTYKTNPRWVKLNDPKSATVERHEHFAVKREKSGKMETRTRHRWVGPPEYTVAEEYEVPHYYTWVEAVPCTIDLPEVSWTAERKRRAEGVNKLCDKRFVYEKGCSCCSKRGYKSATNQAKRAKIKQALKGAINNYGWTTDTDPEHMMLMPNGYDEDGTIWRVVDYPNWWDVDIQVDSRYDSKYWWD